MSNYELELYSLVGDMLRTLRIKNDLTLEAVAEELHITHKTLQRYECGEHRFKIETIQSLCSIYNVDYYKFMKEAKSKHANTMSEEPISKLSISEEQLLHTYKQLNTEGKKKLQERADELISLGFIKGEKRDAQKMA